MNILDATPNFGFQNKQFSAAEKRFSSELVLALAVIHHLVFTYGQSFQRIVDTIKPFQRGSAVYEFVAFEDAMVKKINRRVGFDSSWYNLDNFFECLSENYSKVETLGNCSPTRTLILATL